MWRRFAAFCYDLLLVAALVFCFTLVVLAVVFDQFAATGVLLVAFLSFVLAYLIAPAAERLRYLLKSHSIHSMSG